MFGVEERYAGADALVHLAAVPAPGIVGDHATFANNMNATWNVVSAARRAGVTQHRLGLQRDRPRTAVRHATAVRSGGRGVPAAAGVHLLAGEDAWKRPMAAQLCRRDPALKMIGLRFSNVMLPQDYAGFADFQDDAAKRKWNLWGYIDARDGAQAVRLALESSTDRLRDLRHRQRRHGDGAVELGSARGVFSRRRGTRRCQRARHAAVDRQGAAPARVRAGAQLAWRGRCARDRIRVTVSHDERIRSRPRPSRSQRRRPHQARGGRRRDRRRQGRRQPGRPGRDHRDGGRPPDGG